MSYPCDLSSGISPSMGKVPATGSSTQLTYRRFVLQLISLAGLHSTATVTAPLSRAFKTDGMLAYVNLIQRNEKDYGVDVLTHQKWSGAAYVDGILGAIQSGSSGSKSMGKGNTEEGQFL